MSEMAIDFGVIIPRHVADAPTIELPMIIEDMAPTEPPVITPDIYVGILDYALSALDNQRAISADPNAALEQRSMVPDYVAHQERYEPKHIKRKPERLPARHARVRTSLTASAMARFGVSSAPSIARHAV